MKHSMQLVLDTFYNKFLYQIFFTITLILKNLYHRKRSVIVVVTGLVFSLSVLFTSSIWVHTSEKIIADDYIETLDYEMYVNTFLPNAMGPIYEYVIQDPIVKQVDWLYRSLAIFNFEDKSLDYVWYPISEQENMSNPVSVTNAIILPSRAINRLRIDLEINGTASMKTGELLMSYTQAKKLEAILHRPIKPGDKISVAIARRIPFVDIGEYQLKHFDIKETIFYNYTIASIYKFVGKNTLLSSLFGIDVGSQAIIDSIIFPMDALTFEDLYTMDSNSILPTLLVKANSNKLREGGIERMPDNLLALKDRIEIRFYHAFCRILYREVSGMVEEYKRMFASTQLFFPTIIIALILTLLSSRIILERRKLEIAMLRTRGASSAQIVLIFSGEILIISAISWLISAFMSFFLSGFIPTIMGSGSFSKEKFLRFLSASSISLYEIEIYTLLVLGIYITITFINIFTIVTKDVQESFLVTKKGKRIFVSSAIITLFMVLLVNFILLFLDYKDKTKGVLAYSFDHIKLSSQLVEYYILILCFLAFFITVLLLKIMKKYPQFIKKLFPKKGFIIHKNISRPTKNFSQLFMFMLLVSIFSSFFITLESTVNNNYYLEDQYRHGADIRIDTTVPINITEFEEKIASIEGVEEVVGFYSIRANIGTSILEVYGVDPIKFLKVGRWIKNSFVDQSPEEALTKLANTTNGIIISDYLSSRLSINIGNSMFITDFRRGKVYYIKFVVSGIIRSAPGLGMAHGYDPKMGRTTQDWVLINVSLMKELLGLTNGSLLLTKVSKNANINEIEEKIRELSPVLIVNPEKINPNYIGYFINSYIPNVSTILNMGTYVLGIMAIIFVFLITEFVLDQRRNEYALLMALGAKQREIVSIILKEIIIMAISSLIIGVPIGIFTVAFSLKFLKPLILSREVIHLTLYINWFKLFVFNSLIILALILATLPIILKQTRFDIAMELRYT